jgi:hypothetical protein
MHRTEATGDIQSAGDLGFTDPGTVKLPDLMGFFGERPGAAQCDRSSGMSRSGIGYREIRRRWVSGINPLRPTSKAARPDKPESRHTHAGP